MEMSEVHNGMQVRHIESDILFSVVGVPFFFDGVPAITLQDKRGNVRLCKLSGLVAVNEKTEESKNG